MRINQEQINQLIEAQYHYFESQQTEKATEVVELLMEPLFKVGRYSELLQILEQTINRTTKLSPRFFIFHARSLSALGRHEQALVELNMVEVELKDDQEWRAAILIDRGNFLRRSGDVSKADEILADFREAYEIYDSRIKPEGGSDEDKRWGLKNKAKALFNEGAILQYFLARPGEATERYERALEIFESSDTRDDDGIAVTYKQLGEIFATSAFGSFYNPERAVEYLEKAWAMFEQQESETRILETIYQLARLQRTKPEESLRLFHKYLDIAKGLKLVREEAIAKRHIADLEIRLFKQRQELQPEIAASREEVYRSNIALLIEAERTLTLLGFDIWSRRSLANTYYLLGTLWLELEHPNRALSYFEESLKVCDDEIFRGNPDGDAKRRLRAVLRIAQLSYRGGDPTRAYRLVSDYERDFHQLQLDYPNPESVEELILQLEARE